MFVFWIVVSKVSIYLSCFRTGKHSSSFFKKAEFGNSAAQAVIYLEPLRA
jgi:hypothetical protein